MMLSIYSPVYPFTDEEYRKGIATLKNNKATGIDDVLVEQLKHPGPVVVVRLSVWFISVWSSCVEIAEFPDGVHWSAP